MSTKRTPDRSQPGRSRPSMSAEAPRRGVASDLSPRDLLALYSAVDLDRFIAEAFALLPRMVPCAYVSAFSQRAGDGFLKERDSWGRVWGRAFMRRYVQLTPAIGLVAAHPGVKILATRFALTSSDAALQQTAFYREVMRRQGWRHGAVLCFWADPPTTPIFVLSLYRVEQQRDFSDAELAQLESLHGFLAPAVARFHEISASHAIAEGIATALRHVPRGIVVLDWQLRVELRHDLQSTMRQHAGDHAQRRRHVSPPGISGLSASVTVICLTAAIAEPSFVIEFQGGVRSPHRAGTVVSVLAPLTVAEREVAMVVAGGLSNEEAAERLGKSVDAVKFLLHRVYKKLSVPNRARLMLLVRGLSGEFRTQS
jgi:DNA-binding CsgD family transcriptional regulator